LPRHATSRGHFNALLARRNREIKIDKKVKAKRSEHDEGEER